MGQRHDHLKLLLAERDTAHEREVRDLVDRYERELREVADAQLERRVDMLERSPTPGTVRHLEDVATSQAGQQQGQQQVFGLSADALRLVGVVVLIVGGIITALKAVGYI